MKRNLFGKILSAILCATLAFSLTISGVNTKTYAASTAETKAATFKTKAQAIDNIMGTGNYVGQCYISADGKTLGTGLCNVCSLANMLNRKLALDGGFSTSTMFTAQSVIKTTASATSIKEYSIYKSGYGKYVKAYSWVTSRGTKNVGTTNVSNHFKTSNGAEYSVSKITNATVAAGIKSNGSVEKYFAGLLDQHPEGVYVYLKYATNSYHAVLISGYTYSAGKYTLYVIDPSNVVSDGNKGSSFGKKFTDSFTYKKNKSVLTASGIQYVYYLNQVKAPNKPVSAASTLSIKMTAVPGTLTIGKIFNIDGTIASNYTITSATAQVLDSAGRNAINQVTFNPGTKSFNVKASALNKKLDFNKIKKNGKYTLKITAKDSSGKTVTYTKYFNVTSNLNIKMTSVPTSLAKGKIFNITGTISSESKIIYASAQVLNSSGKDAITPVAYNPNSKSINVKTSTLNQKLAFNKIKTKGTYTLRISATDEAGNTQVYQSKFTIK